MLSYVPARTRLFSNNQVEILRDGAETYPAMLEAISKARRFINLETYIIASDRAGWSFAKALAERAKAGIEVNFMFDALGGWECEPSFFAFLREAGVRLVEYRPMAPWRARWGWNNRDHRKILVVDGEVGFTGGINLSDDYAPYEQGGGGWRDTHCKVLGPLVRELNKLFFENWHRHDGTPLDRKLHFADPSAQVGVLGCVLDNNDAKNKRLIRKAYLHALRRAKTKILITNAYFIPDLAILAAIKRARERGVIVEVMVPGNSDVRVVWHASRALYHRLLSWGVKILDWQKTMLHSKTAVIDGVWSTIGSCNIDHRSFRNNLEANILVLDEDFGAKMEAMFEEDRKHCIEITLADFEKRPFWRRIFEQFWYFFRFWL
jgi:cardiolipin synthase A/B